MRMAPVGAALALVAMLAAASLRAEPAEGGDKPLSDKPLSEQLEEAIRGLVESMKPAIDELRATLQILEGIDSLEHYERPEVLPNGDILMRRKSDAPPFDPDARDAPGAGPGIRT